MRRPGQRPFADHVRTVRERRKRCSLRVDIAPPPRRQRRNDGSHGALWQEKSLTFVREEEERFVAPVISGRPKDLLRQLDRAAQCSTEVVVAQRLFLDVIQVVEIVVRVERIIVK